MTVKINQLGKQMWQEGVAPLLWIVPKWPFPARDGSRQATVELIKSITASGQPVHLCALVEDTERIDAKYAKSELGVSRVYVIPYGRRPSSWTQYALRTFRSLLTYPQLPVTMSYYRQRRVADKLDALIFEADSRGPEYIPWKAVVYEGLHSAAHLEERGDVSTESSMPPIVYRAQNREVEIWERKRDQTKNPLLKAFLSWQTAVVAHFERSLTGSSAMVAAISPQDRDGFQALFEPQPIIAGARTPLIESVPAARTFEPPCPVPDSSMHNVLYVGRLDWPPNREGLRWFLEKVWPEVTEVRSDLRLQVIGSGRGKWMDAYQNLPQLNFLGEVPDLAPYYRESLVCIVPVFYGSGTRIKAIEASGYARACLSTEMGVQGLPLVPGVSYLRAEGSEEWIDCLLKLERKETQRVGRAAHDALCEEFRPQKAAACFLGGLRSLETDQTREVR